MPKKKVKSENDDDSDYSPKGKGPKNHGYFGRVKKATRIAVRIRKNPLLTPNSQKAHEKKVLNDITNKIGSPLRNDAQTPPASKSSRTPSSLVTKSGVRLPLIREYNHVKVYKEETVTIKPRPSAAKVLNFPEEKAIAKVPPVTGPTKTQTVAFNKKLRQEQKFFPAVRKPSQIQVADNVSATAYAKATKHPEELELFEGTGNIVDQKWEWTHIIAYSQIGTTAQQMGNLVCASQDFNTCMMFLERLDRFLGKLYDRHDVIKTVRCVLDTVTVSGKNVYTHNLTGTMEWEIKTPDFTETIRLHTKFQHNQATKEEGIIVQTAFEDLFKRIKLKVAHNKALAAKPVFKP